MEIQYLIYDEFNEKEREVWWFAEQCTNWITTEDLETWSKIQDLIFCNVFAVQVFQRQNIVVQQAILRKQRMYSNYITKNKPSQKIVSLAINDRYIFNFELYWMWKVNHFKACVFFRLLADCTQRLKFFHDQILANLPECEWNGMVSWKDTKKQFSRKRNEIVKNGKKLANVM